MKEFVFGTDEQFNQLDRALSNGTFYKFPNRRLPDTCTPNSACLWFAKKGDIYVAYIDKGIVTSVNNENFKRFLERGETRFVSMDDMADFFRSFKSVFDDNSGNSMEMRKKNATGNTADILDREKLHEINESEAKPKMVWPEEIAEPLKKRVFGQDAVIDALADKIVINRLHRDNKLLAIVLMGPTATGKSETAKSLAEVMSDAYGIHYDFLEIAASEFIGEHSTHRFFGAPPGYVGHGEPTLLEPVRRNPHHVIVINEVEKADDKLLVGLMEAIDTGKLGMADNTEPIDLNQSILLFTSNIPIDMDVYKEAEDFQRAEMCRDAFTKHCRRPEISGKIGNFLVFSPLDVEAITDITLKFIKEELEDYELELLHIDEHLMADFLKYRTKYGARGIKGLISDSIGKYLVRTKSIKEAKGKKVSLKGTVKNIEFDFS